MSKTLKKTEQNIENHQETINFIAEKEYFCHYFVKEREYLLKKYDIYVWILYLYFLENKNLPKIFKSNQEILDDLCNCMGMHKLIDSKKALTEEKVLEEVVNERIKSKTYTFKRLKISIDVIPMT